MRNTGPSRGVLAVVRERDRGFCLRCSAAGSETHHRISRGMGGSRRPLVNEPAALTTLCGPCHRYITEHPEVAFSTGWSVRRNALDLPSEIPLVDLSGHVFFLSDEGEIIPLYRTAV